MVKTLKLLTAITIASTTAISIATYNYQTKEQITVPNWINTMIQNDPNQINIGYDHHTLINKNDDEQDPFQQKDWIDLNQNNNLYLYLPQANTIDEAIKDILIDDSAKTWTIGIEDQIIWTKVNETKYTNNAFITEDTSVAGIGLMKTDKFYQIKNSSKWNTLTKQEKQMFQNYGSLPSSRGDKKQDWWNANQWETLLSKEKNLISTKTEDKNNRFSQLDLYNRWINQTVIGMNVPLSLMAQNTFTLETTQTDHLFLFQSTPQQTWITNSKEIKNILTPHWGFTLRIMKDNDVFFKTPQLINLNDTYKEDTINDYLNSKKYFSFNNQEKTKFITNYLNDYPVYKTFNNSWYLVIGFASLSIAVNLIYSQKLINNLWELKKWKKWKVKKHGKKYFTRTK